MEGVKAKLAKEVTNSIGMKLVRIPTGTFLMGSPVGEVDRGNDEQEHEVEISRPFYLGVCEVTQKQYRAVMGKNPSGFSSDGDGKARARGLDTDDFPVEQVSWEDAVEFCKRLSALPKVRAAGRVYRLPTEAEWEYACRRGAPSYQTFHDGNSLSSRQANFHGAYPDGGAEKGPFLDRPCKVGSHRPNGFGLCDMYGNVWEWTADWYAADSYRSSPRCDPPGPSDTHSR